MKKLQTILLLALAISMSNCQKDNLFSVEEKEQKSTLTAMDYALVDQIFSDIVDLVDEQAKQQPELSGLTPNGVDTVLRNKCIQVSFEHSSGPYVFPATLTLDFGDACSLDDGRTISGKIIAVFTNQLLQDGMQITITQENLVIDGYEVTGKQIITNEGVNQQGHLIYRIDTKDGLVTKPDRKTVEYRGTVWRDWMEGLGTIKDDVWEIIGYAEGFNSNDVSYSVIIEEPLKRSQACRWLINGQLEVKTGGIRLKTRLKFGPEEEPQCDNVITIIAGNYTEEIEL